MLIADRDLILKQVQRLFSVPADVAPEAMVFYCARMLEGICQNLVAKLGLQPTTSVFSNLATVDAHRLIDSVTREFAHTLRSMGNEVRHYLADSSTEDTKLALVLLRKLVVWFEKLEAGEQFADALGRIHDRLDPSWPVISIVELLGQLEDGVPGADNALLEYHDDILGSRFLATLCSEALIFKGRAADAERILDGSALAYGQNKRHREMMALVLSRTDRLPEAEIAAAKLVKDFPKDDETYGIAGGIYKRRWDKDNSQAKALVEAYKLYKGQWEKGGKINAYLGVNAAATALYQDKLADARTIANTVIAKMDLRDQTLARAGLTPHDGSAAAYYDAVSRAEAFLIAGREREAHAAYTESFAKYHWLEGNIGGTRDQAARIVAKLQIHDFAL